MNKNDSIYVAGHKGLVGSALLRRLKQDGFTNIIVRSHQELDLTCQADVNAFFSAKRPDYVFLAAARVGGIMANSIYPAEFIYENISIQTNIIHAAWKSGVKRLLFLGSSCIYPRLCNQPIREEDLLSGPLEPTNEPYAVAKIAGIKLCQAYNRQYNTRFLCVMPTNLYGPQDNFDAETSHVLPALIRKFHVAKVQIGKKIPDSSVTVWGTGSPRREFLHVDDLADACLFLINLDPKAYSAMTVPEALPLINIGWGKDMSIRELAELIKNIIGFEGKIEYDTNRPDGTPEKRLDVSKMTSLGWQAGIRITTGIASTYQWCLENKIF